MERAGWGAPRPVRGGLALLIVVLLVAPLGAMAATQSGSGTFVDDDGNVHEGFIEAIAAEGITKGCNPPDNDRYCPSDPITRGQMAAFFRRAFDLPVPVEDFFTDDSDSIFEDDINAIAEAGITKGCNPPGDDRYCPDDFVTRGQMAAFIRRGFEYPSSSQDFFTDDDTLVFEDDINAIAEEGVTNGCNPPADTLYCPHDLVLRDQMASFLGRALDLEPVVLGTTTSTTTTSSIASSTTTSSTTTSTTSTSSTTPTTTSSTTTSTTSTSSTTTTTTLPSPYELLVSDLGDRSGASELDGAVVSGHLSVFVSPETDVDQVVFLLDGVEHRVEGNAPFDLEGTDAGSGMANPFDTAALPAGGHTVVAEIDLDGDGAADEVIEATFTVGPDQVHLAWTDDPATTLTVVWRTRGSVASEVEYREAGASSWSSATGVVRPSGTEGDLHEVTVTGLSADTRYEYRVAGDGDVWSEVFTAGTAPGGSGPASFEVVYVADTGLVGRPDGLATGTQQVIAEVARLDPHLVLPGGDYTYFNTDFERFSSYQQAIDFWFNQMQPVATRSVLMPTYGNHEVALDGGEEPWLERFPTPHGFQDRRFYSFDVGDVHFVSILAWRETQELEHDYPGAADWIDQDIADALDRGQRWIIPFMHGAPFSDGENHSSNVELRLELAPIFEKHGVQLVLFSHDQAYERSFPLIGVTQENKIGTPTSDRLDCYTQADGVVWLKTSPGGKLSNKNDGFSQFKSTDPPEWTAVRDNTRHHFTRLVLTSEGDLLVETYGVVGDGSQPVVQDDFTITGGNCP